MLQNVRLGPEVFEDRGDAASMLRDIETAGHSVGDMLCEALRSVRSHLGMDVAFVAEMVQGLRVFRHVCGRDDSPPICVGGSDPLSDSYCQRVVDGRLPQLIPDTSKLPEAVALPITAILGIGSYISVPIRFSDGRLYGTFCCFSSKPDGTLNERDLDTLRLFADFAGRLLETQAREQREQEERLARINGVLSEQAYNVVYQPIFNVLRNSVVGYEALARFSGEPQRTPDLWFDEAEQVGLQCELEMALVKEALKGLGDIRRDCYLSINVSPETILAGAVGTLLEGQPLDRLMLEVTEHASVRDYDLIAEALAPMRAKGLLLAVDDAGAGYASFRHILKLKPDVIKLDGSLIRNIDSNRDCRALASALIRFGQETECKIVAECVETEAELAILRELQVSKAQGYLLGCPLPLGDRQMI
ncbi:MAG: diguanylate phosphodiesterase [Pseudomonas sp.]|nr:diguanylate phosphodiesterase [Pseudomonas sp.]HBS77654.1 diguanylate phosphodiesterase [Pseudomonas sp.]|tara:strand:- start:117194 stop:118447 length:1254 start_codon:yes stop_codon:yes gene_type:complete